MLIDTCLTIGYKCNCCGTFEFFNLSLFKLFCMKVYKLNCHCKNSGIIIFTENLREFKIKVPCMACGGDHFFLVSRNEILTKPVNVLHCPQTGIEQCFIGNDEEVRKKIDNHEKELDEMINHFGYESYFINTQVMFDALNRIHDIAEKGNLICECGCSEIDMILLSDKIHLKCNKCFGSEMIMAGSNKDLKELLTKQYILLKTPLDEFVHSHSKTFVGKTDEF